MHNTVVTLVKAHSRFKTNTCRPWFYSCGNTSVRHLTFGSQCTETRPGARRVNVPRPHFESSENTGDVAGIMTLLKQTRVYVFQ
jgi:hypothetical protein